MSDTYKSAFFVIPSHIIDLPGITLAFIKVYETIFQFWNHKKTCFLSNEMIMKRTGIASDFTIRKAFRFFEEHHELVRMKKGDRRYLVQPNKQIESDNVPDQGGASEPGGRRCSAGGGGASEPHNNKNINNKNNKEDKSYCASDDAHVKSDDVLFEKFWEIYPRKKDKNRSKSTWKKKNLDKIATLILADIRNRLVNDAQWKDEQFIPHPSTYLRNNRWEDDFTLRKIAHSNENPMERALRMCLN